MNRSSEAEGVAYVIGTQEDNVPVCVGGGGGGGGGGEEGTRELCISMHVCKSNVMVYFVQYQQNSSHNCFSILATVLTIACNNTLHTPMAYRMEIIILSLAHTRRPTHRQNTIRTSKA